MKAGPRWHLIGALTLAGLLSLYASYFGLMGLLWGGFPRNKFPIPLILLFLVPLLAFPMFMLAAASSRLASFCLWALGPAYSLAMFQIDAEKFAGSFIQYFELFFDCLFDKLAIILWVTAWLVHYGSRICAKSSGEEPAPTIGS